MKTATIATADLGNPHPNHENFENWLEAFAPELKGIKSKNLWILYTAAWCNGVSEERLFNEKIYSQVTENSAHESDA